MLLENLINYGLSDKEDKVYLAALELNESSAQDIAKLAKINRATVYVIIESLVRNGLISIVRRGKKSMYLAANPNKMIELLEQQKAKIAAKVDEVRSVLPELETIYNYSPSKPRIRYFEGLAGLQELYRDTLKTNQTIYSFDPVHEGMSKALLKWLGEEYVPERIKKEIDIKVICPHFQQPSTARFIEESKKLRRELRLVPADKFPFTIEIEVYGSKVAIISYDVKEMFGVIIESEAVHKTMKCIFDLSWEGATKYQENN